jgi:hypothetical protein
MVLWEFGSRRKCHVSPFNQEREVELMIGMYKRSGHEGYAKMAECVEKHAVRNRELMAYGEDRYGKKESGKEV